MQSSAKTVAEYLKSLPADRRTAISMVRSTIMKNLPKGYVEGMQWGMICYSIPLSLYPDGYLSDKKTPIPYAALASQKNYMAVYLTYSDKTSEAWFKKEYKASGKKLDMGKSCVRFKKLEDLPVVLVGKTIATMPVKAYIAMYERGRAAVKERK